MVDVSVRGFFYVEHRTLNQIPVSSSIVLFVVVCMVAELLTSPFIMRTLANHHPQGSCSLALEKIWEEGTEERETVGRGRRRTPCVRVEG